MRTRPSSATEAGGLRVVGGELRLEDVTVTDNVATDGRGGGVFVSDATFVSVGGAFLANRVEDSSGGENHGYGGGLYGIGSELTVTGTRFEDNEARSILPEAGIGAGLRGYESEVAVDGALFRDNVAAESGSAVAVDGYESRL